MLGLTLEKELSAQRKTSHACNQRTEFKFKILKNEAFAADSSIVRTSGVYFVEETQSTQFIRFFDNGRVYLSCGYESVPTSQKELETLNYGNFGHYIIEEGVIKIETHTSKAGYYYWYLESENGEVLISKGTKSRRSCSKSKIMWAPIVKFEFFPIILETPSFW